MQFNRKVVMIGAAFFAFAASPALAQSEGGIEGPPEDTQFYTAQSVDPGFGCSRRTPQECTPEQKQKYNEYVDLLCDMGGGTVGVLDGLLVTGLLGASTIGAPIAGPAGTIHGGAVALSVSYACKQKYRIP